jgi:hypothetical protein
MSRYFHAVLLYLIELLSRRTKTTMNNKPILSYNGVDIYENFKGDRPLNYSYALVANHQAELEKQGFDVRTLPEKYKTGLIIENQQKYTGETDFDSIKAIREAEHSAHMDAIRRAIDDNYDFLAVMRKHR